MNAPTTIPSQQPLFDFPKNTNAKMTSKEIAEVTGKRHDHVMRDIRSLINQSAVNAPSFGEVVYKDAKGECRPMYTLDFHATMTLITGYNAKLRSAVISRWMELEAASNQPHHAPIEQDPFQQSAFPAQPPTQIRQFKYQGSTVEVAIDSNGNLFFDASDVFSAIGYMRPHNTYHWMVTHIQAMVKLCPSSGNRKGIVRDYMPMELLNNVLRQSGKMEKFKFKKWLEQEVIPHLEKPISCPANIPYGSPFNVPDRSPKASYLLKFDDNMQPSITRLASCKNMTVSFTKIPGTPKFDTITYFPIEQLLKELETQALMND